jgi:exopolysaccharide biosynthesis protein
LTIGNVVVARIARRPLAAAGIALFLFALAAGILWRLERRIALEWSFHALTGASLHVGSLTRDGDATVLNNVRVDAAGGDGALIAPKIAYEKRPNGTTMIWMQRPAATMRFGHDTLHRLRSLARFAAFFGGGPVTVAIANGSLDVSRDGAAAVPLAVRDVSGVARMRQPGDVFDLRAQVRYSGASYPLQIDGQYVRAGALPAAPLWALLPPSSIALSSGTFTNVDLALSGGPQGSVSFAHVRGTYAVHVLRGMRGTIVVAPDGIASREIAGFADDIALRAAGEVHDVTNWNQALRSGTRNLRAVARVYDMIAPTPHLHWISVEATAPGVAFGQFSMMLAGIPRVVQMVTIDPHERSLHFDTAISGDHLISKGERTSQMGVRTRAVAGLNGDYFDIAGTYEPQGMFIESHRLLRGPINREALVVDASNNVHFAEFRLRGALQYDGQSLPVTQYNNWPLGYVTVITPDFGHGLAPVPGMRYLSLRAIGNDRYRVLSVTKDRVSTPIHFGVAVGPDLKSALLPQAGGVVRLTYALDPPVPNAVAGIGGGPLLLRHGKWFDDPDAPAPDERDVRWPVDALGVLSDKTLVMVAVDGRHPERSGGMTRPEFGQLLQGFGVTDAMALDSGGSVTLVARAPGDQDVSVRNVPSDDSAERYVSNAIFVYSSAPVSTLLQRAATASADAGY